MASARPVDPSLRALRERIDRLNREILGLVEQRGGLMVEMAALKDALGLDSYDPRREAEMIRQLTERPEGPFSSSDLETIFKALFAVSLGLERRSRTHAAPAEPATERASAEQPPHLHLKVVGK